MNDVDRVLIVQGVRDGAGAVVMLNLPHHLSEQRLRSARV
jgi:hypothetical protein